MRWIRLWTKETFYGTTFQELNAEERGIWFSLLVMAGLGEPEEGKIQLRKGIGYPMDSLAIVLNSPTETVKIALKKLQEYKKILIDEKGIIAIISWEKYQTEYARYRKDSRLDKDDLFLDNSLDKSLDRSPRQIEKKKKIKIEKKLPSKKEVLYKKIAEEIYLSHPRKAAIKDSINSIIKLLKKGINPDILKQCVMNYTKVVEFKGTEKEYMIQSNNFFGQKQRWEEFKELPDEIKREDEA